jgi:hypothetical protein
MWRRAPFALWVAVGALPSVVRGQIPVGPEFQVNTYTTGSQQQPVVAADAAGNFVVVWQNGIHEADVLARWYDASGAPLGGTEVGVNASTAGGQLRPVVASANDGKVVVVWDDPSGIMARRYESPADPPGPEFTVATHSTYAPWTPAVAMDASGDFVVVWEGQAGINTNRIFGRRYDALGQPLGGDFLVNTYTTGTHFAPSVASDAAGNFVVVWTRSSGGDWDVLAQRYDASGAQVGGEFRVDTVPYASQFYPQVSSDPAGNFVVVWTDQANARDIWGQRYDPAGAKKGTAFRVNVHTTGSQSHPAIASEPHGNFVVAWSSDQQDGGSWGVFARRYDAHGIPEGDEFRVNTYTTDTQAIPQVASDGHGRFVVVWHSSGQDGSGAGIFGQRFAPDLIFRDGFEWGSLDAWSARSTDGGDLSVSTLAALKLTSAGLRALVDDTAGLYVQDDTPNDEDRYRARFYFDTNGFDPGEAQQHFRARLFIAFEENPTRRLAAVVLRRMDGAYAIRGRLRQADGSQLDTPFLPVSDGPHVVEIDWKRAAGGSAPGWLRMTVDGVAATVRHDEDNPHSVDFARLGALSVKSGAGGTLFFDEFESRRLGAIGP